MNDNIYIEQNEFIAECISSDVNEKLGLQYVWAVLGNSSCAQKLTFEGGEWADTFLTDIRLQAPLSKDRSVSCSFI